MRKVVLLIALFLSITFSAIEAQKLVSTIPQNRNVVLEEFTGIHCGWCPEGHKIAQSIYDQYPEKVVLINIHQGGYATPSTGEPDFRTQWGDALANEFIVTGYPTGVVNRFNFNTNKNNDTITLSRGYWQSAAELIMAMPSPVNVGAESIYNPDTKELTVNVELFYTDNTLKSTNYLQVAFLENHVIGPQASGGNSYDHKYILRDFLTGQWGEAITETTKGTLVKKTYKYTVPDKYIINNCDIAVYVSESHQNIFNGVKIGAVRGTTLPIGSLESTVSKNLLSATPSQKSSIELKSTNTMDDNGDFKFTLIKDAPSTWTAKIKGGSNESDSSIIIGINDNQTANIQVEVTPDAVAGVATFTIKMESITNPHTFPKYYKFYVVSNVTDLILNNSNKLGDGSDKTAADFQQSYIDAFKSFSLSTSAPTNTITYKAIAFDDIPAGIKNVYYNVGWTFPGLTDDYAALFAKYLDAGGNLFISGQDFAWDCMDSANTNSHSTAASREFFKKYISASFVDDGTSANKTINSVKDGPLFRLIGSSSLTCPYGTDANKNPYMYPDVVQPLGDAKAIFYYNNSPSKFGGILCQTDKYKLVFLGVSLEMINSTDYKNAIIKLTHDWFNGTITQVEFENKMQALGNNYPNPASTFTTIPLNSLNEASTLRIRDIFGNIVYTNSINSGIDKIDINTTNFTNGTYFYEIESKGEVSARKMMNIVK